jgi:hypothetical protein
MIGKIKSLLNDLRSVGDLKIYVKTPTLSTQINKVFGVSKIGLLLCSFDFLLPKRARLPAMSLAVSFSYSGWL